MGGITQGQRPDQALWRGMRIAIIGGGVAGLTTAHLLDPHHAVTLFERAPILGRIRSISVC